MIRCYLLILTVCLVSACVVPEAREPGPRGLEVDHVPIAVESLSDAERTYTELLGFTLKDGRRHANGLRNSFAKFRDGTYIELISPEEGPVDDLAARYVDLIASQEGGAALALRADTLRGWVEPLRSAGHEAQLSEHGPFTILSFDDRTLDWVFLIEYGSLPNDGPELLTHANTAIGILDVWLREEIHDRAREAGLVEAVPSLKRGYGGSPRLPLTGLTIEVESIEAAGDVLTASAGGEWSIREDALGRSIHVPASMAHGIAIEFRELRR